MGAGKWRLFAGGNPGGESWAPWFRKLVKIKRTRPASYKFIGGALYVDGVKMPSGFGRKQSSGE